MKIFNSIFLCGTLFYGTIFAQNQTFSTAFTTNVISLANGGRMEILDGSDIIVTERFRTADSAHNDTVIQSGGNLSCTGDKNSSDKLGAFVLGHYPNVSTYELTGGTLSVTNDCRYFYLHPTEYDGDIIYNFNDWTTAKLGADGTGNLTVRGTGVANLHTVSIKRGTLRIETGGTVNLGSDFTPDDQVLRRTNGNMAMAGGILRAANSGIQSGCPISLIAGTKSTIDATDFTVALKGQISGTGSITFGTPNSTGNIFLSAANTYSGSTFLDGGILHPFNAQALGMGNTIVGSNATLRLSQRVATTIVPQNHAKLKLEAANEPLAILTKSAVADDVSEIIDIDVDLTDLQGTGYDSIPLLSLSPEIVEQIKNGVASFEVADVEGFNLKPADFTLSSNENILSISRHIEPTFYNPRVYLK